MAMGRRNPGPIVVSSPWCRGAVRNEQARPMYFRDDHPTMTVPFLRTRESPLYQTRQTTYVILDQEGMDISYVRQSLFLYNETILRRASWLRASAFLK